MRLLVSVQDAAEARIAADGGADVVDAKDPSAGALGPVSLHALAAIHGELDGTRPLTAALGDAGSEAGVEEMAYAYAAAGASLVKIGLAGVTSVARASALIAAARSGAAAGRAGTGVIAVAYADSAQGSSVPLDPLLEAASGARAAGVLLDTADKTGPGLSRLITPAALAEWVRQAHGAGLLVAVAGGLTMDDLEWVRDAGADVAGVRGAACEGGRRGIVSASRVRRLALALAPPAS